MYKVILGIETSCDETSAAIVKKEGDQITVLSMVTASSAELQAKFGGVIPEQAARKQLESIIPVIKEAITQAFANPSNPSNPPYPSIPPIDAIAVTYGPGLIGSLLVGVETAKTLALAWNKPLLPINHLIGHYYANWIQSSDVRHQSSEKTELPPLPQFPLLGLLVSGGHTDLVLFKDHNDYQYLGGTRDDAAGECFDKCARLLGYSYPGGPKISGFAKKGNPKNYHLPTPMNTSENLDFSFSGLKTAFLNLVRKEFDVTSIDPTNANSRWQRITTNNLEGEDQKIADMCAALEDTIVKSLVKKTLLALKEHNIKTLIVGGGVSANQKLRQELQSFLTPSNSSNPSYPSDFHLFFPELQYCGDNAAMIASAALYSQPIGNIVNLQADPNLSLF